MSKKIIIIGAGIAGLTAGVYARRSGFDVTILERHTIPGGMCTSWRRKGYLFEGGMHWLTGSSPNTGLHKLWRDVGALDDSVKVRYDEPFFSLEWEGQIISLYRDINKLKKHFDEISPQDGATTKRVISDIKALINMKMPITDLKGLKVENPSRMSPGALIKMLPSFSVMSKLSKMSALEYAESFRHPALRTLLATLVPENYGAMSLVFTLATLAAGDGGYPDGGSLAMARRMADKFTGLGGDLRLGVKADKVVTRDGAAVGVSVAGDGEVLPADAVIVTQETIAAAEQLFDTPPKDKWIADLKRDTKPVTCCFIGIGVRVSVPETPAFTLPEPLQCGGFIYKSMGLYNYSDYPGYAPEGGTALTTALLGDSYDFWKKARDEGRYETEKKAVAERIARIINDKYPQTEGKIEVIDVATPLTYERYTGASRGSWMSVMGKGDASASGCPCILEDIKSVYFAGHRTMSPGGLPVAIMSGRTAAQMVCRDTGTVFR